jgi:hypothetical protein
MKLAVTCLAVVVTACSRSAPTGDGSAAPLGSALPSGAASANSAPAESLDAFLPDRAGSFAAEPATHGDGYVRRIYAHGKTRVNVTLGSQGGAGRSAFERWVSMSVAYPQISLHASPDEVNGFFDCRGEDAGASCDGHVHFRTGLHLELFGGGTATREELMDLLAGLPMEAMASRGG